MDLTGKLQVLVKYELKIFNGDFILQQFAVFSPFSWFKNTDICSEK